MSSIRWILGLPKRQGDYKNKTVNQFCYPTDSQSHHTGTRKHARLPNRRIYSGVDCFWTHGNTGGSPRREGQQSTCSLLKIYRSFVDQGYSLEEGSVHSALRNASQRCRITDSFEGHPVEVALRSYVSLVAAPLAVAHSRTRQRIPLRVLTGGRSATLLGLLGIISAVAIGGK